jgi:hypothetical protein
MLETTWSEDQGIPCSFVTLTYSDENLPVGNNLVPKDAQDFFKKLRHKKKIRYFLVGEYGHDGERTWNPHYHIALFGVGGCLRSDGKFNAQLPCTCDNCSLLSATWSMGHVYAGTLTRESASYIAGYTIKKLTNGKDDKTNEILEGRHQEFARMSLKPPIGDLAMKSIAEDMVRSGMAEMWEDVPPALWYGTRSLPLDRTMRRKLRIYLGRDEKAPRSVRDKLANELQTLRETTETVSPKAALAKQNEGKIHRLEKITSHYSRKKKL